MIATTQLTNNLKTYITSQLDTMAKSTPMISFMKPIITRVIDKNFSKVTDTLNMIADKEGNIDIENILEEMLQNVMNTNPFTFKTSFIGDIEIGGGQIKLNLPLTNKRIVLNQEDIQIFKEALIKNS